ncbi:hypothetical protein [Bradyrhizobium sp. LB11.1]|uniref:hypothetical protein n=1 Tax=Bradyrhizobium sp. LB11.1 TaxID=3156326 RepID=UPI003393D004
MMIDCAALVTDLTCAEATGDRDGLYLLPKRQRRGAAVGKFRQSINRHVDCKRGTRPAPFDRRKIVNQNRNTCQDVLQSNEIIRHGSRGLKSKCRIPPALTAKKKQEFA